MDEARGLEAGQRVRVGDPDDPAETHAATVRYVGELEGHRGTYVGVEWDAAGRGKNDGSVGGRRYFAGPGPASCSFLRAKHLAAGRPLLAELRGKYCEGEAIDQALVDMTVHTVTNRDVRVELRAEGPAADLAAMRKAYLPFSNVVSAGPAGEVRAAAGQLVELDLSASLLNEWGELDRIGAELPGLRVLDASRIRFRLPAPAAALPVDRLAGLRVLVLNRTGLPWRLAAGALAALPELRAFHFCGNGVASLDAGAGAALAGCARLETLILEDNALAAWAGVEAAFGALPRLERLQLSGNALAGVGRPGPAAWGRLRALLLGRNAIADWGSVDALDAFPALEELRLSDNPVLGGGARAGGRHVAVARVRKLRHLNGSPVTERERRESELRYLRNFIYEHGLPEGETLANAARDHPRLPELLVAYRESISAPTNSWNDQGSALQDSVMKIHLTCVVPGVEKPSKKKRVPRDTTLGKLKVLIARIFDVGVEQQKLFLKSERDPVPVALTDDAADLHYLGVAEGNEILVNTVAA